MKRKNQNKYNRARVVTLIIMFRNVYQIFRPVTLLKNLLITNQYVTCNYCLINSEINALTTLLWRIFMYAYSRHKHFGRYNGKTCNLPFLSNEGKNCFLSNGIYSSLRVKKEIIKSCNKLSMKVDLLVEFNREKYNLNYKPHIYKSETMT